MRLGKNPRILAMTTPRPVKLIRDLIKRESKDVFITRGITTENEANLPAAFIEQMLARYGNSRLGRQELLAEVVEDVVGALWQRDWIERDRIDKANEMRRIVIAIDPAASSGEDADETGIVVCGLGVDGRGYVLEDISGRYLPHEWARHAIAAYHRHKADRIIAEKNNGGEMVENTIRMIDASVPYKAVHASRGKVTRAEPIAALYERRKISHIGAHPLLEDQLCNFSNDFDRSRSGSPDRLDALVWCLHELLVEGSPGWGLIEWTRQEAERVTAGQIGNRKAAEPPSLTNGGVMMRSPTGADTAYGMEGDKYTVGPDGIFIVKAHDVGPLRAAGWGVIQG
jgi:predicted phage terminase large subunit-like protein